MTPPSGTTITADDGGSVSLAAGVVAIPSAQATATITVPQLPQGVTVNLASSGTFTGGTTFDVPQGDTVNLTGGTFTGGMTFNVAQGATISVGGGFSGSEELLVSGSADRFRCRDRAIRQRTRSGWISGSAVLTLDFPGSMFQWTGGAIDNVTRET